jgi:hypothetical protein
VARKRKVLELETVIGKEGFVRNRVPREEITEEVVTPKRTYTRRRRKPKDPNRPSTRKNPENDLTPQQEVFAHTVVGRMLAGGRGAIGQTARDAGYKAGVAGSALLKHPAVLRVVDEQLNAAIPKMDGEGIWLLERLGQIVDFDVRMLSDDLGALDDATAMALEGVDIEYKPGGATVKKYKAASRLAAIRLFLEVKRMVGSDRERGTGTQDRLEELNKAVRAPLEEEKKKKPDA